MNIKLMKLELKNLSLYSNNALEIDFFAEKRVYEHEKDNASIWNTTRSNQNGSFG